MNKYIIQGGHPLSGVVTVSGAKNAAVAILPAALLINGTCRIENVPDISDVRLLLEILDSMGAKIRRLSPNTLELCCTNVRDSEASDALVRRIRASYYFIGAQLGRFGHARVALPGGCNFGARPIDQHIKGFEAIGAAVDLKDGFVCAAAPADGLTGGRVNLDVVSVGATMNIMIGAVLANGTTVIENAAKEPHIVDLANFLNAMGAKVSGAGTDVIKIRGVRSLHGGSYSIIPDQIETGTYMAAVAATGGDVLIQNVIPKHMDCISAKLREMGVKIAEERLAQADLILAVFDTTRPLDDDDRRMLEQLPEKPVIAILNKSDQSAQLDTDELEPHFSRVITMAAREGSGLEQLQQAVEELFYQAEVTPELGIVANARQKQCLEQAREQVQLALEALDAGELLDAVTVLLEEAANALLTLTGERVSEAVVNDVFSRFCVGK